MKLLTLARDLQRRRARERQGLFVAEGVRAVEALLASPVDVRGALLTGSLLQAPRGAALRDALAARAVPVEEVSDHDFATAADTDAPQGVLAMAAIPSHTLDALTLGERATVLVLDAVQDPGNLGTILRTAAAFGAAATLALPGTVDLWNAKVVRGAMGASFTHPALHCTWEELDAFLARDGVPLWAADAGGTPADGAVAPPRLALALGNEGNGLSPDVRRRAAATVSIPITDAVESLNVAVAAGILLYQFRR